MRIQEEWAGHLFISHHPSLTHRHVLISLTFPYGIVTMALVDAKYEMPGETLKVHYWPRDSWFIGLPYVEVQDNDKSC